jgi:acyl transferase domain-containing protein
MAALGIGRTEAALYLERGVVIACDNSPSSVTLSGDREVLESIIQDIRRDDDNLFVRLLKTDGMAYHSHHMAELGPTYEEHLQSLMHAKAPSIPFYSSVTGKLLATETTLGSRYWRHNLESPVEFFPAVKALINAQGPDQLFFRTRSTLSAGWSVKTDICGFRRERPEDLSALPC